MPKARAWANFPELGEFGRGKPRHRPRNDPDLYKDGKYKLVQTGAVARAEGIITTNTGLYNDIGLAQSPIWPKGTLCIPIAANIADSGILGFDACIPDSVVGFIPFCGDINYAKHFEFFMRTAKAQLEVFAPATAQKNINIAILESLLIPIPPLEEQHRIIAKVEELTALCDSLQSVTARHRYATNRLLESLLRESLAAASSAPQ